MPVNPVSFFLNRRIESNGTIDSHSPESRAIELIFHHTTRTDILPTGCMSEQGKLALHLP